MQTEIRYIQHTYDIQLSVCILIVPISHLISTTILEDQKKHQVRPADAQDCTKWRAAIRKRPTLDPGKRTEND